MRQVHLAAVSSRSFFKMLLFDAVNIDFPSFLRPETSYDKSIRSLGYVVA